MKPENRQFLEDNRHHHTTLIKAQYLKHLNGNERSGMQRVMSEEFVPGYTADLWCPDCVSEMVLQLYRRYDEWLLANPDPVKEPEIIEQEPLKVQASFPSNKKNHHR